VSLPEAPLPEETDGGEPEPGVLITSDSERSSLLVSAILLRLRSLWPWIVVAVVAWLGWKEVQRIDLLAVRDVLRGTRAELLLALLAFTGFNLALAGLYDVTALGSPDRPPRIEDRWTVGVATFAWSNFLTMGPLAGPALRLWLYKPLGVEGHRSRSALSAIMAAFSMGLAGWCVAAAIPLPATLDSLAARLALGALAVGITAAILRLLPRLPVLPKSFREWEGRPSALAAVAAADWFLAWVVFHLAIFGFHSDVDPVLSLKSFFLGQLIGLASLIPGGLGSADAYWILTLATAAGGHDRLLASLILYRAVYYLLPWIFASLYLLGQMVSAGRRTRVFIRTAMAGYAFLCGVVLLGSAATPALADRLAFLNRSVPLAVVEISHWVSVLLGFFLLVISRGLLRGYRSSHRLALALFVAGALTTFVKGLDFEEALFSLGALTLLLIFRRTFQHAGRLQPPVEFIVSVGLFAVVLFVAVGFGSYAVPGLPAAFNFEPSAQPARFLRALIVLVSAALAAAFHYAQRARAHDRLPAPEEIDRALSASRLHARSTNPLLVAAGDKALFWPEAGEGGEGEPGPRRAADEFIAYRTFGRFLIAYSDPVCAAGNERQILSAFLEEASARDHDVILYQISGGLLPVAHDFGFSFFKLGEEGIVNLDRFDLKGNKAKKWRHAINRVEKEGGRFEIVQGEALRALLPEMRRISDAWLERKQGAEKGFSIGRFDEEYLARFPCALVRDGSGRLGGFANILEGKEGEEISVDLMRYLPPKDGAGFLEDVIEYLFLQLMLHGKERGFARFNLGMAPLSSVGELQWARPFERLAHLFFRHGEHWFNFQGLRRFKEKFEPEWEPRYMAYPRPWDWPAAVTSTAVLIAGGWPALLFSRRRPA
jgi:phosphatidylglycerol lysyltransferase